jgi:hypothetical protein
MEYIGEDDACNVQEGSPALQLCNGDGEEGCRVGDVELCDASLGRVVSPVSSGDGLQSSGSWIYGWVSVTLVPAFPHLIPVPLAMMETPSCR